MPVGRSAFRAVHDLGSPPARVSANARKPAQSIGGWSSWYPPREATQRSPSTASATRARRSAEVVTTDDEKRRDADVQLIDPCWKSLRRPPSGWCQPAPQAAARCGPGSHQARAHTSMGHERAGRLPSCTSAVRRTRASRSSNSGNAGLWSNNPRSRWQTSTHERIRSGGTCGPNCLSSRDSVSCTFHGDGIADRDSIQFGIYFL